MPKKSDVLYGTISLMVVKPLAALGSLHGYRIARRIEQISGNQLALNQGTFTPRLLKLEQMGWVSFKWGTSESRPTGEDLYTRELMARNIRRTGIGAAHHACTAWCCGAARNRPRAAGRRDPNDGAGARGKTDIAALQRAAARSLRTSRLLLAAVGIYSVPSYIVRGRSREIRVGTALDAQRVDVLRLVIVEGMWPVLTGIAAGTIAALASAKVMETLVFGVSASDPLTLTAVAGTLAVVPLLASLLPAYRALRLDPVKVLRAE